MNLHVELADGTTQTISISSSSTIEDVVETIANNTEGLKAVADRLSEFSLAHRDKNSEAWVNVSWLDPTPPVLEQTGKPPSNTTLLFRKKYFSTNDNLRHLDSSPALRQNIYSQLRHTFIAGLYKCSTFQAVQIAAMVAKVEFSGARLGVAGTLQTAGSLKQVLPPKFSGVPGIEQLIVKATRNISHLSKEATQMAFIQRLQRLETFGLGFFTVVFEEGRRQCEGLLGIGAESIFKIDREEMESLAQWETASLCNYYFDRNSFTMVFGSDECVTMATMHGHMISEFLSGVKEVTYNGKIDKMVKPVENGIVGGRRRSDHDWKQQKSVPPRVAPKPRLKPSRTQPELRNLQQHQEPNMQSISDTNLVLPAPPPLSKKPRLPPKPDSGRKLEASPNKHHITPIRKPHYPDPLTQLPTILSPTTPSYQEPVDYLVPILSPASTSSEPDYAEVDTFSSKVQGYVAPGSPSGVLSRQRGGRHLAVKRKLSKTTDDSSPSPPLGRHGTNSPPLTKEKTQAPPRPPPPQLTPKQGRSSPHRRAPLLPKERTPSPQRERTPSPPHRRAPPPPQEQAPPPPQERAPPPPHRRTPPPAQERAPSPPHRRALLPPQEQAPPPTHRRAPPPPQERTSSPPQEQVPSPPHRRPPPQKRAPPPPQERAPPPPQERGPPTESIYDTVSDDPTELSNILEDTDLLKDVRWSQHDENPIYDLVAANEAQTLLRNSDVTYKTLSASFKRQMKLKQVGEAKQKSPVPRRSGGNRDQILPSKAAERTNLDQPRVPGITKRVETDDSDRLTASPPPVPQRTYTQLSSYAQPQIGTATGAVSVREVEEGYSNPEQFHILSERHRFHSDSVVNSKPQVVRVENNREEFGSGDTEGAGYAIPENVTALGMRRRLKSEGDLMEVLVEEEGEAEVVRGGGEPQKPDLRPPKPPRMRKRKEEPFQKLQRRVAAVVGPDTGKQKARLMKPGEIFKDYAILLKEFRMFVIKLPTGVVHIDLVNLSSPVQKLTARLCQLLCAEDPDMYSMYVEGASLTNVTEHDDSSGRGASGKGASGRGRQRTTALDYFTSLNFSTSLPDQGPNPILLDPHLSFRDHGITTTRILALKPKPSCRERLPRYQILVPDWVRFHQCWLNVVQGGQPCSLQDAIKLAALQYQAYFLDRTELNSVIGFCKSTEFLPLEHSLVKGIEEKVFSEQQLLEGYTHKQAQDCYIHASCSLPTYGSVFFPCKEVKKRFLQNNKLTPILIGISREGIIRVDPKTKEVLDLWQYQVLKNWGFSGGTFVLDFADTSYPIKTNQGRWIADLINFHIEAIARDEGYPPPPPQEVFHPTSSSPPPPPPVSFQQGIVQQHYEMNTEDTERIYEKLFPVSSLPPEQPSFSSFSPGSHNTPEPTLPSSAHHHYYILEQNSSHNVASPTSSEERVYDVPEVGIPLENTVQNDTDDEDPTYDDVIPVIR